LALFLTASALAQKNGTEACPAVQWLPISGRVLDATDGSPISGATVFYRGIGDIGEAGHTLNPPSLKGEVKTGPDGSYKFPVLPAGTYYVRAVAPGYLGGRRMLAQHRAEEPPPPPGFPPPPDPIFRLPQDTLHLTVMSEDARIKFSFPRSRNSTGRNYGASAFSPDGNYLGLMTADTREEEGKEPQWACILLRVSIASGDLTKINDQLPKKFCGSDKRIALDGDSFYVYLADYYKPEAFRIHDSDVTPVPITDLPSELKERWTPQAAPPASEADDDSILLSETTADGKFTIVFHDPRSGCKRLMEVLKDDDWKSSINACDLTYLPTYLFDRYRDRVYGFISDSGGHRAAAYEYRYPHFAESDLITRRYRTFTLPQFSYLQLLAFHPMPDGGTRFAYGAKGECDEASADSPQTVYDPVIGPERPSICFITIPPETKPPAPSADSQAHP
jgi:hypothetical protein